MDDESAAWFVREILPHEPALTRYLARVWPNSADVPDLRNDIYIRMFEAAGKGIPHAAKSFLFTTARHLLTDRARRRRIVSIDLMDDLDALNVLIDEISPERRMSGRQQLSLMSAAFNRIPAKCREVLWLQRVEGLAHKQIAAKLGITKSTVEKHAVTGLKLLVEYFANDAVEDVPGSPIDEAHDGHQDRY